MLANLSLVVDNGDTLSESLEQWVYEDMVSMLLVHDIQLTVHTLEALYQLSELGHVTTNHIANVKAAIGKYNCFYGCSMHLTFFCYWDS